MSRDQLRLSQLVTTFGPGSMMDLPDHSIIVSGVDHWRHDRAIPCLVKDSRLEAKVRTLLGDELVTLRTPPAGADGLRKRGTSAAHVADQFAETA